MALSEELSDREMHRQQIADLLTAQPWQDVPAETLKAITPHYQQRISECRRKPYSLRIVNVPCYLEDAKGRKKRLDGAYRFEPQEPHGRDATQPIQDRWPVDGAPYGRQKPQDGMLF